MPVGERTAPQESSEVDELTNIGECLLGSYPNTYNVHIKDATVLRAMTDCAMALDPQGTA